MSYHAIAAPALSVLERISAADRFFAATTSDIPHGGNLAYSMQGEGRVQMPPFEPFKDQISYFATLAYELTDWTKYKERLDRILRPEKLGRFIMRRKSWWQSLEPHF